MSWCEKERKGNARIIDDSEIGGVIREEIRGPRGLSGYRGIGML